MMCLFAPSSLNRGIDARWQILAALTLILFQGAMITGLLFEHRRRLYFEVEAARRSQNWLTLTAIRGWRTNRIHSTRA
jgi:hypothetical protein